ncbi:hypothetical protein J1614_007427 [Plenodomus biglobosus]|nr:hypothetical protein J1614_007427 [Plenodomus biglobosus]
MSRAWMPHDVDVPGDPAHEGETCDEYECRTSAQQHAEQIAQEEASLAAIAHFSKKCPGPGCGYNIEKNNGCDHMTCKFWKDFWCLRYGNIVDDGLGVKCSHEFCWLCLCDYDSVSAFGNSEHGPDCSHYA